MATLLERTRTSIMVRLLDRSKILRALDRGSIFAAFAAALLWFLSAAVHLPAPKAYTDEAPDDDPFFMAIKKSARISGWAAEFAGVSVILSATASWVRNRDRWPTRRYGRFMEWIGGYKPPA